MAFYLDTSAFLKLVVVEAESSDLRAWMDSAHPGLFASELLRVEALKVARQCGPLTVRLARRALLTVTLVSLTTDICNAASRLDPPGLRSLDALHLATALAVGEDLDAVVTYDARLADAAMGQGLAVLPNHGSWH